MSADDADWADSRIKIREYPPNPRHPRSLELWRNNDLTFVRVDSPGFGEVTAILDRVDDAGAAAMVGAILGVERVFVVALGRSGMLARMFAMRLMQIGLTAHVVGDVTTPAIAPGDLLVAISGSGRTGDGGGDGA